MSYVPVKPARNSWQSSGHLDFSILDSENTLQTTSKPKRLLKCLIGLACAVDNLYFRLYIVYQSKELGPAATYVKIYVLSIGYYMQLLVSVSL